MNTQRIYSLIPSQDKPGRTMRASDKVESQLVKMILSLEIPPGAMIDEAELKTQLKCGRTPLREALLRLAQERLIVSIPRKGMFVAKLDLMNYVKLIEATGLLESFSAYLAVDQCSTDEIDDLEDNIANTRQVYDQGDLLSVAVLDFEFHRKISEFTRNEYIIDATIRLHRLVSRYFFIALKNGLDIQTSIDEHHRILKAFRRRDGEETRNLIHLHTVDAKDRIAATMLNAGRPVFPAQINSGISSQKSSNTIRIGVPAMMTGPGAPMGADIIAGIGMAVETVNAQGGVLGRKLEIVYADIKDTNPVDSRMAAKLLDNAGIVVFFPGGFYDPSCAIEFAGYKQPLLHASANKETVDSIAANLQEYGNVFQMCASEQNLGSNAFTNLISLPYDYPNNKIALLGSDISYDMLIQKGIVRHAQKCGWEIVLNDSYPFGSTRFDSQLARIRSEDPAIIFGCITSTDSAVEFVKQFLQHPTNSLLFLHWSPVASKFIHSLGEEANGILWQTEYGYLPTHENIIWLQKFMSEFGREPGVAWPAMMDDMLHIWIKAVEHAGDPTKYDLVIDYIRNLSKHPYRGRAGTYGINQDRNEGLSGLEWIPIHIYQIRDQKNALLFLDTKPFEGTEAVPTGKFKIPPWIKKRRVVTTV
ncbi:MAG: ABC transporter substrate-binding protein [Anaerolineaceae bacterium]|nr:ABC transporter substrate-binding protein [Anaerolineaceae bacterium]